VAEDESCEMLKFFFSSSAPFLQLFLLIRHPVDLDDRHLFARANAP
jgi:hypothetical protein